MRRLAQQLFSLLRQRAWLQSKAKAPGRVTRKLHLEALEDRFLPATSVTQLLPAALTGTAFVDHNNNGRIDAGEIVLPGATISLSGKDTTGKAVSASTVTDVNGVYKFLQISPGVYNLSISTKGSFLSGLASAGSQGGIVSGSVVSSIAITQGETLVGYNLGVVGLANVGISLRQFLSTTLLVHGIPFFAGGSPVAAPGSGIAYADGAPPPAVLTAVGTGSLAGSVQDTAGHGLANVIIGLTGVTGSGTNAGLPTFFTTTTDATGAYAFSKLAAGAYSINLATQPAGFRAGTPVLGNLDGFISQNNLLAGIDVTTTAGTGYNFTEIPVTAPTAGAAAIEAHLLDDTAGPGGTTSDGITSDPTIAGLIANVGQVTSFTGVLDGGAAAVSLPTPNADGSFILSRAFLNQMAPGGLIADGQHTLHLAVTGAAGSAGATVTFTLQSAAPLVPAVHLDSTSDPSQNGRPIQTNVTILGTTSPNAHIDLIPSAVGAATVSATGDNNGNFSFAGQTLSVGPNDFTIRVTDIAGNQNQTQATFVAMDRAPTGTVANVTVTNPAPNQVLDLAADFTDADTSNSLLRFHTAMGNVDVQLNDIQDPQTVANFLNYVKSGRFNDTIFHRLATGFVLQGGGFTLAAAPTTITPVLTGPPVKNEFPPAPTAPATQAPVNVRGTIAMAKISSGANPADSATSQFFFNLANNSGNLDSQNGGFTVFATIADGFSQRIVDNMASEPVMDEKAAAGAAVNTVQTVAINGAPTGGTFTLNRSGTASVPIAFNAAISDVANAVGGLPAITGTGTIGAANVNVTGTPGNWTVTFVGTLAGTNVLALTAFSSLTGGNSPSVTVNVATPGSATNPSLNQIPLVNYSGSHFPTDATAANFEVVNSVEILRNTESLTYAVTNITNPAVASATLDPTFNNRLTLQFLTAGTTSITVVATDKSNKSVSSTFTVTVGTAAANQAPVIAAQTFTAVAGGANGTVVGSVQANDPDAGQILTYAITAGNTNNAFQINSTTGQITVADTTQLNIINHPTFALKVQVMDNGTPALSSSATVTINLVANATPPTINSQSFTVAEGSANNTVLGTVAASGANGQGITYAITGGNTGTTFQINNTTGQLSVANSANLVLASHPSFSLTVTVTDTNSTRSSSNSATVTVNLTANHAPTVAAPQTLGIPQNSPNGTVVGTVAASDPDPGQTLTYVINTGNTDNVFAINPSTGQITVADATHLNADAPYQLTIIVTDNAATPLSSEPTSIRIVVPPANHPPTVTAGQTFTVVDGSPTGTVVGTVAATDSDAGQTLTYKITSGNTGNTFQINSAGQITVANDADLNIALFPTFTLQVQATDNGFPPLTSNATPVLITLTANHAPTIANQTFNAAQGSINGTVLGTVAASDPDAGQALTYSITGGNVGTTFQISSATGQLTVINQANLNTATHPTFALTVQVIDNNARPLQSSATVTVNVTANNAPVIANQSLNVLSGSANGTVVGTVAASDPDAGQLLTYAITAGNASGAFNINPATGQITVADTTKISSASSPIPLTVQVTDNASPPLSSSATVNITVTSGAVISAALVNDTGTSTTDGITSDPTIAGTITNVGTIASFRAGLDDPVSANWVDVTNQLTNGAFTFNLAELTTINHGTAVADGPHTLRLQVTDGTNSTSAVFTVTFTLKRTVATPSLDLDPNFDTAVQGDHTTSLGSVSLIGATDAGATLVLKDNMGTSLGTTTANASGNFSFTGVSLAQGANLFTVTATDAAGNQATFSRTITRADSPPTVSTAIANVAVAQNHADTTIDLAAHFTDADFSNSVVQLNTSAGPIDIQLFDTQAPQTVANYFNYINSGAYNNTIFHRLAANFVLQGGGFKFDPTTHTLPAIITLAPVPNEFGISNTAGTVAMAKLGTDPNSATDQFFFNLADNSSNLDHQNGGFTVFGKILGAADQTVLNTLAATPVANKGAPFDSIPLNNYTGTNFPTDATAGNFLTIQSATVLKRTEFLTYSIVSNTNPSLVTPSFNAGANEMLALHYAAGQTGTSTITIRATDRFGATVDQSFQVTVS